MAGQAIDRFYYLFVWNIVRVEARMAGNAQKLSVRRFVENLFRNVQGDFFTIAFGRQTVVAVTGKAIGSSLCPYFSRGENLKKQRENG
jgi:hypothetical protein